MICGYGSERKSYPKIFSVPLVTPIQIDVYFIFEDTFLKTDLLLPIALFLSPCVIKQTGENFEISSVKIASNKQH